MTTEKKLTLLEEMLEMDGGTLSGEMKLAEIPEWDSLAKLSLIVLMDDEFKKAITANQIRELVTVQDILNFME